MALVTGALGSVIPKLYELLEGEYNLQTGLRKKIESLTRVFEYMQVALGKVSDVPPEQLDDQVKLWARDVRELSYHIDVILDTFLVRVDGREARDPNRFKRAAKKIGKLFSKSKARHQIGAMIKIIDQQDEQLASRRLRYQVDNIVGKPSTTSTVDPRLHAMYKDVSQLIGIDKSRGELISMLTLQGDKMMKTVSVVGVGGLGKTTLANAVYEKLKVNFKCAAFVPVGRDPDLKKVFKDLLIDLDKKELISELDERQLINELRKYLEDKRYFIVIDDIWETKSWETIKLALVKNNSGSRIITTTRKLDVAKQADEFYELQPLPYKKSKKLFYTRIFDGERGCPDNEVDDVSDKMIKKCGGIPLAIITMASLLVGKSRKEWIEVCNSIIFRNKDNQQVSDTEWILSLSYYDLPAHLKTCLLYLCAFPEDYRIEKYCLIWMWVAEGFVHKESGAGLFEVGEGYFNELVNRSLIQLEDLPTNWDERRALDFCRVHDMVLDLIRVKSGEENFVTISSNAEGTSSPRRVHRLAQQNRMLLQTRHDTQMDLCHVRSFMAFTRFDVIDKSLSSVLSFELLRVLYLDCHRSGEIVNLQHVEKLLHLRYLRIMGFCDYKLPKGIGALKFLQTIYLGGFVKIRDWSGSLGFGLLTQLKCLRGGNSYFDGEIKNLTSLEELQICCEKNVVGQIVKDLGKVHELRVLIVDFYGLEKNMESDLIESLANLRKIRYLTLAGSVIDADEVLWGKLVLPPQIRHLIVHCVHFTVLPSCINASDLHNLTHLKLVVGDMDEQSLRILGGLPELRYLTLRTYSTVTITIHAADGCFQKLKSCSLTYSTALFVLNEDSSVSFTIWYSRRDDVAFGSQKGLVGAPAVMPNLQQLYFCVEVRDIIRSKGCCGNLGLEYLPSLERVMVAADGFYASADDVEREEAALRRAIEAHPNRPTLEVHFYRTKSPWDVTDEEEAT